MRGPWQTDGELDRQLDRDAERERRAPRRMRLIDQQLALLPRVEVLQVADAQALLDRVHEFSITDRCFSCGARAIGTRDLGPAGRALACVVHADTIGRPTAGGAP